MLAWSRSAPGAEVLTEADGIQRVCTAGPLIARVRAERLQGSAEVAAAAVLPNPSLVIEHQRTLEGPNEQETVIGASIPLGISGRRALLRDAARARQAQWDLQAEVTLFEAALAFREAYVLAASAARRLDILTEQQALIDALGASMQRLSQGGEAAGYDLSRQDVQAKLHRALLNAMRGRASAALALLEVWTGAEVALPEVPLDALAGGLRMTAAVDAALVTRHPRSRLLKAESRASALEGSAARRRWVPDLELFAGYRSTTVAAETGAGISLSLNVPFTLFDHGQGEARLADARKAIADATASAFEREQAVRLRSELLRLRTLETSVSESDRAIEQARAVQTQATRLYAAGEVALAELFDAFRSAEAAALQRIDLTEEIALARLAIMRSAGSFFDPALDRLCHVTPRDKS